MSQTKVSFIIPHKGREEMLLQTLHSIKAQDFDSSGYEVVLVSQNESLSDELKRHLRLLPSKLIQRTRNLTISALRNMGVAESEGQYLAFLDADVELSANWLTTMLELINARPSTLLVSAYQINSNDAPPLERIRTALSNAQIDCAVTFLPGRNLFLARDTFERVGGFPEHLVTCEDYYFTERVSQLGELYYTSQASYVHIGEDKEYGQMFHKEIWRGQSNLASLKGRHIPPREWASFLVPPWVMLMLVLALGAALFSNWQLSFFAIALLLLPIATYSARLKKLAGRDVSVAAIVQFYAVYFPARAIGTIRGAFKQFTFQLS